MLAGEQRRPRAATGARKITAPSSRHPTPEVDPQLKTRQSGPPADPGGGAAPAAPPGARGHVVASSFRPAWWLPGGHLQTLWPFFTNPGAPRGIRRERLELGDGDFLDLHWLARAGAPLACVFHGLEGCIGSHYAARILPRLHDDGFSVALLHFRGCGGIPNRLARSYHAGETGDIDFVLRTLAKRHPQTPLVALGYSLGGNALLKHLAEAGRAAVPCAALVVSAPLQLGSAAEHLARGFSRVYQRYLLGRLRRSLAAKRALLLSQGFDFADVERLRTFREFDDHVTAPLHGFAGVDDYYARAGARRYLRAIVTPTLIVHACNDPFTGSEVLPRREELAPSVILEVARSGGHVGFVSGAVPGRARYWLDERISDYLRAAVALRHRGGLASARRPAPGRPGHTDP